ncbi:MAG TPA: hypothetical protein VIJ05_13725, partial [Actinomycetes bacterium]
SQPAARRYLRRPEYSEVAREAVKEMARQVGPLVFDSDGLARRGLLLRHLKKFASSGDRVGAALAA